MLNQHLLSAVLFPMAFASALEAPAPPDLPLRVYVGTSTQGDNKGIYQYVLNAAGRLESRGQAFAIDNPSFLAMHPTKPILYAVSELKEGTVTAFRIDSASGALTLINRRTAKGAGACHLCVSPSGAYVAVANYNSGSVALLPIAEDGSLGEPTGFVQHHGTSVNPQRQEAPHAHGAQFDVTGRLLFITDLGLDKILEYCYGLPGESLAPADPAFATVAPGAGPRHMVFHPSNRYAYVVNEMGNTVSVFKYAAETGRLTHTQDLGTLPAGYTGESTTAEIQIHPSGRFLYVSNRGHDSIAAFGVDAATGKLTALGLTPTGGKTPRSFCLDPSGHYLLAANQDSSNIMLFRIDQENGAVTPTGQNLAVPHPDCVLFVRP